MAEQIFVYMAGRILQANERSFCLGYKAHKGETTGGSLPPFSSWLYILPQSLEALPPKQSTCT